MAVGAYVAARWMYEPAPESAALGSAPAAVLPAVPMAGKSQKREARAELTKQTVFVMDDDALQSGALPGQRVLAFKSREAMEAFLQKAGANGIEVLGRMDQFNTLRVSSLDPKNLDRLLDGEVEKGFIFPVQVPNPKPGGVQPDAVALGSHLTDWLNVSGDRSDWGAGVKVAVLDTGVVEHRSLGDWSQIALVPLPTDGSPLNPHGLAVSSLITGNQSQVSGAAPGAELLSVVVADARGQSDTYTLASGILAAVDGGASVINISMGSYGDSSLMRQAIEYAQQHQVVIVAAAGNEGLAQIAYPAGYASTYSNVIAVGAVDAGGEQMLFSNSGAGLSLMAPGYEVNAAYADERYFLKFTGTSGSTPVVAGAIAAMMSHGNGMEMTAYQAAQTLIHYADEGGVEGNDANYGAGLVDLGRAMQGKTPGLTDVAVASQTVVDGTLQVVVENRGTEPVYNPAVDITIGSGSSSTIYVNGLKPGETRTVSVPYHAPQNQAAGHGYSSRVRLSGGQNDARPANNSRARSNPPSAKR